MNIRLLRYALALERYGSFQEAARASNISASGLSRAISSLELESGLRLFDRSSRDVIPTAAGRDFISGARMLVRYADDLDNRMRGLRQATAGSVTFGLAPLPAGLYLSHFLIEMLSEFPDINVHAKTGAATDLAYQLDNGEIEFLICANSAILDTHIYQTTELCRFKLYLMTRKGHPFDNLDKVLHEDLDKYPLLGGSFRNNTWPLNSDPIAMHSICNSYEAIFTAVSRTDACCLSPKLLRDIGGISLPDLSFHEIGNDVFPSQASFLLINIRDRPFSLAAEVSVKQFRNVIQKGEVFCIEG